MATSTVNTNKPIIPRGVDDRPVDKYNRAELYSGKALDFDGVNDHITISNSNGINITGNALTIAGYINTDGSTAWQGICYKDGGNNKGYQLFVDKTGDPNIAFGIHTGGFYRLYSNEVIENNKWYFVVATYDGANQSIYINGAFDNSQAATGNITDSSAENLYIGRNTGGSERFNGEIGGFKIFNTALTATQVADLYNNPEKVVPTGVSDSALKLWLPMQEGAGTTAYDGSGNGNHGTISGATYTHGIGAPVAQTAVIDWNKGVNLLTYSEEINESVWTKTNVTITADQTTAPDGQTTADEVLFLGNGLTQFIGRNATTTAGEDYTISVYAKYVDQQWLQFTSSTSQFPAYYANFDIQNGVTGTISGATGSISDAGNGWYRINVTMTAHSSGSNTAIFVLSAIDSGTATRGASLTATNKTAYVWGVQGEQADAVGPYVRTGATAQTSTVLLPQGLTSGRDITGVNPFENVRKQSALNLDGNSWAEVHDNASLDFGTGSFSLEAWVKAEYINTGSAYNIILNLGSTLGYSAGLTSGSGYIAFFYGALASNYSTSNDGSWVHIVGTYDGTNATIYANGVQESQAARTAIDVSTNEIKYIGKDTNISRTYKDQIAQPRIYNRALTASEVLNNYNATSSLYI